MRILKSSASRLQPPVTLLTSCPGCQHHFVQLMLCNHDKCSSQLCTILLSFSRNQIIVDIKWWQWVDPLQLQQQNKQKYPAKDFKSLERQIISMICHDSQLLMMTVPWSGLWSRCLGWCGTTGWSWQDTSSPHHSGTGPATIKLSMIFRESFHNYSKKVPRFVDYSSVIIEDR